MNKVSAKMCVVVVFVFMPACVAYGENTKNLWINDPQIDIDVNYVYRSGNDNSFQQLNEGNVVKSGDSFKIIFTPKEDSYLSSNF